MIGSRQKWKTLALCVCGWLSGQLLTGPAPRNCWIDCRTPVLCVLCCCGRPTSRIGRIPDQLFHHLCLFLTRSNRSPRPPIVRPPVGCGAQNFDGKEYARDVASSKRGPRGHCSVADDVRPGGATSDRQQSTGRNHQVGCCWWATPFTWHEH